MNLTVIFLYYTTMPSTNQQMALLYIKIYFNPAIADSRYAVKLLIAVAAIAICSCASISPIIGVLHGKLYNAMY
jgi:hypothetical protein